MLKGLFNKKPKKAPVELYIEHLDRFFTKEPEFFKNESEIAGVAGVSCIVYRDIPEKGMLTAFTYGLSLVKHPDWKFGRPELTITVDSDDILWGIAIGHLANRLRGDCPFSYSNTINFGEKISQSSEMDAFWGFCSIDLFRQKRLFGY